MKVLIIAEDLLPGGATIVLRRLIEFYLAEGNEVVCITGNMSGMETLPEPCIYDADAEKGGYRLRGRMRELRTMHRLLRRYVPDLVVINVSSPGYMYAFMMQKLPVLYHMHTDIKARGSVFRKLIYPRLRGENKKIITVSKWHGRHVQTHWGVHKAVVVVLPNYPDLVAPMREQRDTILTAARFHWSKNPFIWREVGLQLNGMLNERGMRMIWCAPRWTTEAQTMQETLPSHMQIIVPECLHELRAHYSRAAVYLQPSIIEPQGIAVLEALQNGIPCVVSDGTGMSEAVRQNITGFIAQQGNIEAHVEALSDVIVNEEKARRLGEMGRELVATEYSASAWRQRYRECIVRAVT